MCIACKDAFQTNGGTECCTMAEEQEFDLNMILKECKYAEELIINREYENVDSIDKTKSNLSFSLYINK